MGGTVFFLDGKGFPGMLHGDRNILITHSCSGITVSGICHIILLSRIFFFDSFFFFIFFNFKFMVIEVI